MPRRIVLFGATGYTGRLTAEALVARGARPVLAGRSREARVVGGQNPYAFTAAILAWGAETSAQRGLESVGALGPVERFGLDALEQGCREAGLARV